MKPLMRFFTVLVTAGTVFIHVHAQTNEVGNGTLFRKYKDTAILTSGNKDFSVYQLPIDNMLCLVPNNQEMTTGNPLVNFYRRRGYNVPNAAEIEKMIPSSKMDTTKNSTGYLFISSGCGFAGTTSPEFGYYRAIIRNKSYDTLRADLLSPDLLKKVLSVIALDSLSAAGNLILAENEKSIIEEVKLSRQRYCICSGCTMQQFGYVADIFTNNQTGARVLNFLKAKLGFKMRNSLAITLDLP